MPAAWGVGWPLSWCEKHYQSKAQKQGPAGGWEPPPQIAGGHPIFLLDEEVVRTSSALSQDFGRVQKRCQVVKSRKPRADSVGLRTGIATYRPLSLEKFSTSSLSPLKKKKK